ncbi:MAG: lipid-A-disaccharide synthase [Acidobacteriota bacterium]
MLYRGEVLRFDGEALVVAGEASGDHHAGGLMRELHKIAPGLRFHGMGGEEMAAAGLEVLHDARDLAVMGLVEVAGSLWRGVATYRALKETMRRRRPRVAILVDFPDFNLPLARAAHALGIPVVLFISPQLWAWRAGRVRTVARHVDRVICILPFEAAFYRTRGVSAVFVGHPLVDAAEQLDRSAEQRRMVGPGGGPVLALVPGSRRQELAMMLPAMLDAAGRLARSPGLGATLLPVASTLGEDDVIRAAGGASALGSVRLVRGAFFEVLAAADVALVASGTSTLAAALASTPMVLGYRIHPLTYLLGRHLTRVDHVGLVNLVAGSRVVPERLQDDFTGEELARQASHLLRSSRARAAQRAAFSRVRTRLGPAGALARAAEVVIATVVHHEAGREIGAPPGEAV